MRVQIAARHCDPHESVKERAEQLIRGLNKFEPSLTAAELIFKEEKHHKEAEGILYVPGAEPVVAEGEGEDFDSAVDRMIERLGRMLRRKRSRRVNHKGPRHAGTESEP